MLCSAPQMGTHVQPAYVEQLFGGMGYGSGKVGGKRWKAGGAVGLVKCASAYLFAFCGDITRQSFSEHN